VTKYVLDTNLYIEAARDRTFAAGLAQFTGMFLPQVYLHAVVAQELMVGTINEAARRQLDRTVIQPFERRRRVMVPNYLAWKRSGEILAELFDAKVISAGGFSRSFPIDVLLATSCHHEGLTIITRNVADFDRISNVEQVRYTLPWPAA
jgi:predicted nucleic acid-binding protein